MRRRELRAAALLGALVVTAAGCTGSGSGCTTPDDDVVAAVMAEARSGFPVGDTTIDRLELVRADQVALPEDARTAGGVALLALRTARYEVAPQSGAFPGIEVTSLFLLDADDAVVGPVGVFATESFDVPPPDVPDWAQVSADLQASPAGQAVQTCAAS